MAFKLLNKSIALLHYLRDKLMLSYSFTKLQKKYVQY